MEFGEDDTLIRLIQFLAVLLLALACGNVGILILARTATRSAEIAIRTALGASRARLVGQIFVESLLLAVLAVGIGLGVGQIVATTLDAPVDTLPFWTDFRITQDTVVLAMWLAVLSAGIAGVVPALKATGKSVHSSLQRAASGGSGIRFGWASSVLIVAEVTVAVWFLSLGAVMAPSAISEPGGLGIETDQYLYASLRIPRIEPISSQVESYEVEFQGRIRATHEELARRLAEEPGIGPIAIATRLPGMAHHSRRLEIEGDAASGGARGQFVQTARVDVGYFDALDQPILIGRNFNTDDLRTDRKVVIVNTNFVDKSLGGRNPIGRPVRYAVSTGEEPGPWLEIVGVVGHLGMNGENPEADAGVYEVVAAGDLHPVSFAIRVGNDPESYTPRLRAITTEIDPGAMIQGPQALHRVFNADRYGVAWGTALLMLLSAIAVTLSAAGLYALMSFTVAQRKREIGIRTALGAMPGSIVGTIAKRAFAQLMVGVSIGVVLCAWMFSSPQWDSTIHTEHWPLLVAAIATAVLAVGMFACISPTRRGLRVRPVEALKG